MIKPTLSRQDPSDRGHSTLCGSVKKEEVLPRFSGDIDVQQILYVNAFPLLGKYCIIKTTHDVISRMRELIKLKSMDFNIENIYRRIYRELIVVRDDEIARKAINGHATEWKQFCIKVVLLYCLRNVLYRSTIPACIDCPLRCRDNQS